MIPSHSIHILQQQQQPVAKSLKNIMNKCKINEYSKRFNSKAVQSSYIIVISIIISWNSIKIILIVSFVDCINNYMVCIGHCSTKVQWNEIIFEDMEIHIVCLRSIFFDTAEQNPFSLKFVI